MIAWIKIGFRALPWVLWGVLIIVGIFRPVGGRYVLPEYYESIAGQDY